MLKSAISVFFLCLLRRLDCTVSQNASGVLVQVYEGAESVLLPCQVPADVSSNSTAVVWNRDEFTIPTVHIRVKSGDDNLKNQNQCYTNRTWMRVDALQTGDLSLTLRNPKYFDSGTYTCNTRRFGKDLKKIYVQLKVSEPPPPPPVWPIVVAALVAVVLLLLLNLALYGVCMHRAHNKVNNRAVYMLKPEVVREGVESVRLPWREGEDLPAAFRVKWTHVQPTKREICVCVKDQGQWKLQPDSDYEGRIEMARDDMTNGDFSLTLIKPHCEDGGLYLCVVYGQDGKPRTLTIVVLWVKETWETTITGLFLCGEDKALHTKADKWTLSTAISEMFEDLYGNDDVEGENAVVMLANLDGNDDVEGESAALRLANLDGNDDVEGESAALMLANLDGNENAEAASLLNAQ